jgi:hypothetical protein
MSETVRVGVKNLGYVVSVNMPCPQDTSVEFRFMPMLNGSFQIRYPGNGDAPADTVLDIKMGSDVPGTAVILYEANGLANQQFRFNLRPSGFAAILPGNTVNQCLTVDDAGRITIQPCNPTAIEQEWQLLPPDCVPPGASP